MNRVSNLIFVILGVFLILALVGGIVALIAYFVSKSKSKADSVLLPDENKSYFDGGTLAYIGYHFLVGFVSVITFGLAYPWMCCVLQKWQARHTVICGKRMYFDGTGIQLIGKYILWSFLTIITFGIYGFWKAVAMEKWIRKHTHFVGEEDQNSYFDGGVLGYFGTKFLSSVVLGVPVVGFAWSNIIQLKWFAKHTVVDSRRLVFVGTVGNFFVKYLLWGFLTMITFGIYAWFVPIRVMRLETENTIDHEHTTEALMKKSEYRNTVRTDCASFKSYRVEDEMEWVKAGITDATGQEDLLAIANSGVRAAQYLYCIRYAEGQYQLEPYISLLKSSAMAEYAPAMCLYALYGEADPQARRQLLDKAAEKGQISAIRDRLMFYGNTALSTQKDGEALPLYKEAVRCADLLVESHENLSEEEAALAKKCVLAIRRIESSQVASSGTKAVVIAVVAALVGIPLIIGILAAILAFFRLSSPSDHGYNSGYENSVSASELTQEFFDDLAENYYQVEQLSSPDEYTEAYRLTCNHYYWSSDYQVNITQENGRLMEVKIFGNRVLDPNSPDPTINEMEMADAIRTLYDVLDLGEYEDVTPYTGTGIHEERYYDWVFYYENDESSMKVSVFYDGMSYESDGANAGNRLEDEMVMAAPL